MIDRTALLDALKPVLLNLEKDLRDRSDAEPTIKAKLTAQYEAARASRRTAEAYSVWRDELVTQIAVAWVLGTVFIRFLEDNELLDQPWISGPGDRRTAAEHEREEYFRTNKLHSDRDYLEYVFRTAAELPGLSHLFDPKLNPLWQFGPTGDAVTKLLRFWQERNPDTGVLNHDFTDAAWDTRFLGDLYQDLSEAARKRYALLQTPLFIEEFILERTLDPAIQSFGLKGIRMIDPTCGSGHFVLGGFDRILKLWQQAEPATPIRELAQRALDSVFGVDLNPFAVGIARFRLLISVLKAAEVTKLKGAPSFRLNLAAGDSLLHGAIFNRLGQAVQIETRQPTLPGSDDPAFRDELKHHYEVEDVEALHRILGQQYHAVVGNPPYITVKDAAVSELYRARFLSCHRKYSLSVPFMERFFDLTVKGDGTSQQLAGFVGQITANSFMKREFGKKLIEEYLPRWDLTHVLDTSGAYIPGHGTPTVILFGRNQPPVRGTIRTVLGIAGEQTTPNNPTEGLVWQAILRQIDVPGVQSRWVSSADSPRTKFHSHPWSIGGGGAADLKATLDDEAPQVLDAISDSVGYSAIVGDDDIYVADDSSVWKRKGILTGLKDFAVGDSLRDWASTELPTALYPHGKRGEYVAIPEAEQHFWAYRAQLRFGLFYGKTKEERGLNWRSYAIVVKDKLFRPEALLFASVATHNHFVYDTRGMVSNKSAPGVKLLLEAGENEHVALLGPLNSSCGCFWMKQVFYPKGGDHVGQEGARVRKTLWDERYDHDGTKMRRFPIPSCLPKQLPNALVETSTALQAQSPGATLASWSGHKSGELLTRLSTARQQATRLRRQLIALQEELDWQIYEAFKLLELKENVSLTEGAAKGSIPPDGIALGERAFEIVMARRMAAGELQTTWFQRHGSTPITEVPEHWPTAYRELVERRIQRIADDPNIRLIEQPEYKRRWNTEPWDEQLEKALEKWLLDRIERAIGRDLNAPDGSDTAQVYQPKVELLTTQEITDLVLQPDFREAAELYRGRADFDPHKLIAELIQSAAVPFLPGQRYKESGLRKRVVWEETWDKQRAEDAIDDELGLNAANLSEADRKRLEADAKARKAQRIGDIPVPPKYDSKDFRSSTYWSLRGKLDVPKERFISYPGCGRDGDPCPTVAWAGLDHLQQAKALAAHYGALQQTGAGQPMLLLVLAGLNELLPWLKQWHNQLDPEFGLKMGDYYEEYVREEAKRFGKSLTELKQVAITTT